jgi:hypothetical protein
MMSVNQCASGRGGRSWPWKFALVAATLTCRWLAAAESAAPAVPNEQAQAAAVEPAAPVAPSKAAAAAPPAAADEEYKATKKIPARLMRQVLGCWQLENQERWTISRLDLNGAQVTTKLLKRGGRSVFPDHVRRAAVPATLMYDARQGNFGFATPARVHPSLVVFKPSGGTTMEASLYAKKSTKDHYAPTGKTATLQRCKAPPRGRATKAKPATTPPRLK